MRAGFTLLEVLTAFVIMSIFLVILVPQQAFLFNRAVSDAERLLAQDYAFSVIETLGISEILKPRKTTYDYREWFVALHIEPLESSDIKMGDIWSIEVDVRAADGLLLSRVRTYRAR